MIAILGGTFDPIHLGHITVALEVQKKFQLSELRLTPCYEPVHRAKPEASPTDRLNMLKLAVADTPIVIDEREINSQASCYTVDSLQQLRQEVGPKESLAFILGMDAFNYFTHWKNYLHIVELCHLILINRPNHPLKTDPSLITFLEKHQVTTAESLLTKPAGFVYCYEIPALAFSATAVREQGASTGLSKVDYYIKQHHLYNSHTSV